MWRLPLWLGLLAGLTVGATSLSAGASTAAIAWRSVFSAIAFGGSGWLIAAVLQLSAPPAKGDSRAIAADAAARDAAAQAAAASQPEGVGSRLDVVVPPTDQELFQPLNPPRLSVGERRPETP